MNFSVETKIIRTEKIKEQEEKDKKELKELAEDKDMSLMLEYFYALTADADDGSDVMGYFRSVKNHGLVGVTEDIYTFSNENLDHLFKKLNVKGKKVLTVGSGGDQAIYSIYKGAREVDLIDANVLTKAIVELKLAAIKAFDLNIFCEFMQVLTHGGEKLRDGYLERAYRKLSAYLPKDVQLFWDNVFLYSTPEFLENRFIHMFVSTGGYQYSEFYNNERCYNKLKKKLLKGDVKINYIFAEFRDFPEETQKKYDVILLSNIKDYIHDDTEFSDVVEKLYRKRLNWGGMIQVQTNGCMMNNEAYYTGIDELIKKLKANQKTIHGAGLHMEDAVFIEKPKETVMEK